MTLKQASSILKISYQRVSQLRKVGRLVPSEDGVTDESVELFKNNRKNGRPLGSYKVK